MAPAHQTIPPEEWQRRKGVILRLWFDDNLPLEGTGDNSRSLMQVMKEEHNFVATRSQYESAFRGWGAFKNLKRCDWEVILPIYGELEKRGLKPRVMVGDHILEEKKIRKARRRYLDKENGLKRELIAETRPSSDQPRRWRIEFLKDGKHIEHLHSGETVKSIKDLSILNQMHNGLRDDSTCITNPPSEVDASRAAISIPTVNTSETGVYHAFPPVKAHRSDSPHAGELVGPSDVSHCLTDEDHGASYGEISSLLLQAPNGGSSPSRATTLSAVFSNEGGSETSMFRSMRVQQNASQLEIRVWGFLVKYQRFSSVTSRYEATDSGKIRHSDRLNGFLNSDTGVGAAEENDNRHPTKYKVGILCALPKEYLAVRVLFDRDHGKPDQFLLGDSNHYSLGQIGWHMVVVACLPAGEYGTNAAAEAASNMKRSFPNVKFCLMIGIGGGAPSHDQDIRLGDVVVSMPTKTYPGVIQYDRGKACDKDVFERTGALQPPPRFLMTAVSSLSSNLRSQINPLGPYLQQIFKSIPHQIRSRYQYPGREHDRLFNEICYKCVAQEDCSSRKFHLRLRAPRESDAPEIHYGLIASGNMVIRDARLRDVLASQYEVMCFEMEAAGVMNILPSLVIRGICDYADAYKNGMWQEYAAATAAAYGKVLLMEVSPSSYDNSAREPRYQKSIDASPPRALSFLEKLLGFPTFERLAFIKGGLLFSLCLLLYLPFLHQYLRLPRETTATQ
ncbi:unnamed protein product [Clonostachys rhizophaga]|uniref:Clr5 domain-containing protein n=1 Tax=Clonostachys rhizophaga TaxID=160324 RepID=A0A9N9VVC2_9HYPO|nr:unnamed protein product [Clonostachys rhizophaga]